MKVFIITIPITLSEDGNCFFTIMKYFKPKPIKQSVIRLQMFLLAVLLFCFQSTASELTDKMNAIAAVSDIKPMENSAGFAEKYSLKFEHPLDYNKPDAGTFTQRVFVCHVGFDRPTVIITEGYGANYGALPYYTEEITVLLNANLIICEYRYFLESMPEPCNWDYLTVENSLGDLHEVVTAFKTIYPEKWLATGVSKGGQTTMFYRAYYPDDVDVSVPYVAPLNKSLEDGRHEPFIANKPGTPEERQKMLEFQTDVFKRKAQLLPFFKAKCNENNYHFRVPIDVIFDYWVLEYSFAYWQYYSPDTHHIPNASDFSDQTLVDMLFSFNDPSYFQDHTYYTSFNVQACKELGYYGYDMHPFRQYMSEKSTKKYLRRIMMPEELSHIKFSKKLYRHTKRFLKHNDPKMIFIYGEYDPWSASGVCAWLNTSKKHNLKIYVQPGGSHISKIGNMPSEMGTAIEKQLKEWMF